jgi:hypothetical protein
MTIIFPIDLNISLASYQKMPDIQSDKLKKKNRFIEVLKVMLFSKFPINILAILIIIAISIAGFEYLKPGDTPTGKVVLEKKCPECICEAQEITAQQEECELDCSLCPVKTKIEKEEMIYYKCRNGELVTNLDDCTFEYPDVPEESSGTVEFITLAIDNVEIDDDDEESGFVTRIDYTIINKGDLPLVPKLEVKVYDEWNNKVRAALPNKVIEPEIVVNENDYVQRKDSVRIYFKGKEQTVRLLLIDTLPKTDQEIVAVTKDISLD